MSDWVIGIIIAIAFGTFIGWLLYRRINPFWHLTPLDRALKLIKTTPIIVAGAKVFYEKGIEQVDHPSIAKGIDDVFARAGCRYPVNRPQHDIKIAVVQGERAPESGIFAFRVAINSASPYYNGEFDMMRGSNRKTHYLLAAGQMAATGTPYGDVIIIPSSPDKQFIEDIVDYELEHILLSYHDDPEFKRTMYHGAGTGHPILGPCPGESLARVGRSDVACVVSDDRKTITQLVK